MDQDKQQLVKKLQESANVLVTVSNNPSVDQLAAALGLTLVLNKLGKHATAVFSGEVPSTIEFLKPEETLEKTTDSLRDFIISLDKSKADKLRYKVEDKVVKIFITPYRTSLTEKDLIFSQGDFNVDVIVALGVHEQKDFDTAITAHGRILHDAAAFIVNRDQPSSISGNNILDAKASSLSEIVASISLNLKEDVLDAQISTAFLTGVVAETDRFSNEKTTPSTMTLSAKLMAAGANQQLVATKLQKEPEPPVQPEQQHDSEAPKEKTNEDGALVVEHVEDEQQDKNDEDEEGSEEKAKAEHQVHIDEQGRLMAAHEKPEETQEAEAAPESERKEEDNKDGEMRLILEPPSMGGTLTANTIPEHAQPDPSNDPLSASPDSHPILNHGGPINQEAATNSKAKTIHPDGAVPTELPELPQQDLPSLSEPPAFEPVQEPAPEPDQSIDDTQTLSQIEESVDSPHVDEAETATSDLPELPTLPELDSNQPVKPTPALDDARDAVLQAINASTDAGPLNPIEALNANPIELNPTDNEAQPVTQEPPIEAWHIQETGTTGTEFKMPENLVSPDAPLPPDTTAAPNLEASSPPVFNPTPNPVDAGAPPVPPPFLPELPGVEGATDQASGDQTPPPPSPFNLPS